MTAEDTCCFQIFRETAFSAGPKNEAPTCSCHLVGTQALATTDWNPASNGLTLDPQGRLTACEHGDRRVSVLTKGGGKRTLVDNYQGKRLNSPNDLVFSFLRVDLLHRPTVWVCRIENPIPRRELDFCGVYRLDTDGSLTLVSKELARPNGIGLSPDEKNTLRRAKRS